MKISQSTTIRLALQHLQKENPQELKEKDALALKKCIRVSSSEITQLLLKQKAALYLQDCNGNFRYTVIRDKQGGVTEKFECVRRPAQPLPLRF